MRTLTRARASAIAVVGALLVIVAPPRAQAQNAVITGRVTSEVGVAIEGANVYINDLSISVGSNANGVYTITIPAARVSGQQVNLRIRSFGFQPQVRPIRLTAGGQTVNFVLKQDVNRLAEIVVTGVTAGTEAKKLPFSVARVDDKEMPVPGASPLNSLQGKVPGMQMVAASGRPGSSPSILMRGPKSINGQGRGQGPLFIVDGVVLQGGLADVNPQDIESIEVVKGAAASSLYGSRAGAGVIQIKTKSGSNASEGVRFNARSEMGFGDIENEFKLAQKHFLLMDEGRTRFCTTNGGTQCGQTVDFAEEALRVNENAAEIALPPVNFNLDGGIARAPTKFNQRTLFQVNQWPKAYNPIAQIVTNGQYNNNTIDVLGKNGGTSYFASGANFWQQGAIRYLNGYKRNSFRANVDQNIGEDWTFGVRSYYSRNTQDGANHEQGAGFFRATRNVVGTNLMAKDKFGRIFIRSNPLAQGEQNFNPLYEFANARQTNQGDRFLGNLTARYTPLTWMDFDGNLAYDRNNSTVFYIEDRGFRQTGTSAGTRYLGYVSENGGYGQSYNAAINGQAHRELMADLNGRFTARFLYEQQDSKNMNLNGSELAVPSLLTSNAAISSYNIGSSATSVRSVGYMTGAAFDYKDRYFLDGLIRRDGSSLFGSEARWADYGRVSAAWRMTEESFWFLPQLSEFKLRASYGTAGGRPSFAAQYETFTIGTGGVLTPQTRGNKHLRPETTYETELGIDAEAFNRYGLNLTYATSVTKDQILPVPPPLISGFTQQWQNAGTLSNKTVEASLNIPLVQKRNWNWSTRFNYDRTLTKIDTLTVPEFFGGTTYQATESVFRFATGEDYGAFYGRKFVTSCSELPAAFASQCGAGKAYQKNNEGFVVYVGNGNTQADGITKNLWNVQQPGCVSATGAPIAVTGGATECTSRGGTVNAPWGTSTYWGNAMILRNDAGAGRVVKLGKALPDFRLGLSSTFNYKKLFAYTQVDGTYGQYVWNEGRHWSLGDFMDREIDQKTANVGGAKPLGYYWRAPFPDNGAGTGGFYDFLGVNSRTLEKASFTKIREVNLAYNIGPIVGVGDFTVSVIGRNLKTFTDYLGFDPEVGITANNSQSGSAAVNQIDSFQFPNVRTFTFSVSSKF